MPLIRPEFWKPVGVDSLEPTAEYIVHSSSNTLVVAGPGSGKTELLAQRACFLLETGTCSLPRRILAISFKRDAAKNLGERVRKRCGDRAKRFDSFTLDAFAKSLVDRFIPAFPVPWRPKVATWIGVSIGTPGRTLSVKQYASKTSTRRQGAPDSLPSKETAFPAHLPPISDCCFSRRRLYIPAVRRLIPPICRNSFASFVPW